MSTPNNQDKQQSCVFHLKTYLFFLLDQLGGKNITNDIARGIPTTINNAERLKNLYGSVISSPSDEYEIIDVPDLQDNINQSKQINRNNPQ